MARRRTAAHEETELLTVPKIPFRRRVAQMARNNIDKKGS